MEQRECWLREIMAISRTAMFARIQIDLELRTWLFDKSLGVSGTDSHRPDTFNSQLQTLIRLYDVRKPVSAATTQQQPAVAAAASTNNRNLVAETFTIKFKESSQRRPTKTTDFDFKKIVPISAEKTQHLWGSWEELIFCADHLYKTSLLDLCVFKPRDMHPLPALEYPNPNNSSNIIKIRPTRGTYPALEACLYLDRIASVAFQRRGSDDPEILMDEASHVIARCIAAANSRDCVHHDRDKEKVSCAYFRSLKGPNVLISKHATIDNKEKGDLRTSFVDLDGNRCTVRNFPITRQDLFVPFKASK